MLMYVYVPEVFLTFENPSDLDSIPHIQVVNVSVSVFVSVCASERDRENEEG